MQKLALPFWVFLLATSPLGASWYPDLNDPALPESRSGTGAHIGAGSHPRSPRADPAAKEPLRARLRFTNHLPPRTYIRERGHPRFTITLDRHFRDPISGRTQHIVQQADTRSMCDEGWMVLVPTEHTPGPDLRIEEARIRVTTDLLGRGLCFDRRLLDPTPEDLVEALGSIWIAHWLLEPLDRR